MKDLSFFHENQLTDHGESLFEHLPGFLYFVKDKDLRFVAVNNRLCEKIGAPAEEILGKTDYDFFPPSRADAFAKDDRQVLETGVPIHNKVELVPRGKGFVDWSSTTKVALRNQSGEIIAVAGTTRPFASGLSGIDIDSELGDVLKHMRENFSNSLKVTDLARMAHLSVSAFERKFKKHLHMTPLHYIRHLRIQDACYQLSHDSMPLSQIAANCGFVDQSHFSREFSRIMNETPLSYRKRHRASS
ncbi:HTH-type transcriptional activator RhaS [Rubritalea halochordaticola]|uniref:HTH-type transcriptional activator RhaS n=1 Tax=Rubritalea halochordaticola TaxID=714537 RepID=A0ABP9UYH6_9BACT